LDSQPHATAVNQLLMMHGTHAKIKAAALNQKPTKGVKVLLPINNNNFWKYALLQQPTQLSAPSTSTSASTSTNSTSTSTSPSSSTTTPSKRQRTSEVITQSTSSDTTSLLYMYVKQQQQIDGMATQLSAIKTILDRVEQILSNPSDSSLLGADDVLALTAPAAPAHPKMPNDDVDDDDVSSGLEHESDNAAASTMPQRTQSAPALTGQKKPGNKRRRSANYLEGTPLSKNTRAHSRR
jgi:hypothetical protein